MNKTALFVIFLVAPLILAQHDVLNMLDKTNEGKNLLDNLFLQTQLMGDTLDISSIRSFLNHNRNKVEDERKHLEESNKRRAAECAADEVAGNKLAERHYERQYALKRQVDASRRIESRINVQKTRSEQELADYRNFQTNVQESLTAWQSYFSSAVSSLNAVVGVLRTIIEATKVNPTAASFVELGQEYHSTLTQIKTNTQSIELEYTGVGPILNNLLEIMSDVNAVNPDVRTSIRTLADSLLDHIRDRIDEVEEQHEHQSSLFQNLVKSYGENVDRASKEVAKHQEHLTEVSSRVQTLDRSYNQAADLSKKVNELNTLRGHECENYNSSHQLSIVSADKATHVINEVERILADKAAGLKSFFIQREMTKN